MRITDFAIIFVVIVFSLFIYTEWRADDSNTFQKLNHRYDNAMTVSVQDAIVSLKQNAKPNEEPGYNSSKFNRVNPEPAFDTYMQTMALNFEVKDSNTKDLLERYVPVFSIVDYDGAHFNVYQPFTNENGHQEVKRVWLPKIPFAYHDAAGNIITFTLDEHVTVYDRLLNEWVSGHREVIKDDVQIPLLHDSVLFDQVRRDTIVNVFQEELAFYINEHNVYTKRLGITYTFALPLIPQEDWYNTIDDVSIIAFFQGYPYERGGGTFNQYAFAGSRLVKKEVYHATSVNSKKIFYAESCGFDYPVMEVYGSKKSAVKAGYFELPCLNQ